MTTHSAPIRRLASLGGLCLAVALGGCESFDRLGPPAATQGEMTGPGITASADADAAAAAETNISNPEYLIGPGDSLEVFVWRADELSTTVTVRPDGRISTPLVQDMLAAGKTPSELTADIETALARYVKTPQVTVMVRSFSSTSDQQIRVLGEARQPLALPYEAGMTVLDVMLRVGGMTEYAAGNRAKLIRTQGAGEETFRLRLNDLLRGGDVSANVEMKPGDVIIIPETRF